MKVLVLLNPKSGTLAASATGDEPERIRRGFMARGVEVDVRSIDGEDLSEIIASARHAGVDAVIAGGGDGTLNSIANILAGGPVPFGVLPLGTHNHFAREMNVPLDLDQAVAALATGVVRDLDVGEVNGRVFLNFSGIGLHPHVVRDRDEAIEGNRRAIGHTLRKAMKMLAGLAALVRHLERLPLLQVWITPGGAGAGTSASRRRPRTIRRLTPSVIVCNNAYQMAVFGVENVACMRRDMLNVFLARSTGPVGVIRLLVSALLRRLGSASVREFESICLPAVQIALRRRKLPVSIDGEVVDLSTPLIYKVRRGGLKVIVPVNKDEG